MPITYKKLSLNQKSTYYYILCNFPIQFCVSLCIVCTGKRSGISVKGLRQFMTSEALCCLCRVHTQQRKLLRNTCHRIFVKVALPHNLCLRVHTNDENSLNITCARVKEVCHIFTPIAGTLTNHSRKDLGSHEQKIT